MATAKKELELIGRGAGILNRCREDEPVFILRAQDALAADCVEQWAIHARAAGCPVDKVREAFDLVDEMRRWPIRKNPD